MADTYVLVVKTHGAHWNVRGSGFFELHAAFEAQYQALLVAADDLAERVRALGQDVPATMSQLAALSNIGETSQTDGTSLVRALRDDHRAIAKRCRDAIAPAQEAKDEPTADLLIKRAQQHDKTAWMLSATLGS
jgi:starvation-inducible DNA-binding protein